MTTDREETTHAATPARCALAGAGVLLLAAVTSCSAIKPAPEPSNLVIAPAGCCIQGWSQGLYGSGQMGYGWGLGSSFHEPWKWGWFPAQRFCGERGQSQL